MKKWSTVKIVYQEQFCSYKFTSNYNLKKKGGKLKIKKKKEKEKRNLKNLKLYIQMEKTII